MSELLNTPISFFGLTMPFSLLELFLRFALPVVGFLALGLLIRFISGRIRRRLEVDEPKKNKIFLWVKRITRLIIAAGIILATISLFGAHAYSAIGSFVKVLNQPFFSSGNTSISIITLLLLIPVFTIASWAGKIVKSSVENRAFRRFGLDAERAFSAGRLIRYAVMTLVLIFGLTIIGIDLSALSVLLGVAGIGLGFGLQSLVADFFAGIRIISMGMVKDGDRIRVGEFDGIIQQMGLMNTEITTFENESLIVPNSYLSNGVIHNYSHKDKQVVIINIVDVAYESDLEVVIQLLKEVALQNPWLDNRREIHVRVIEFASSGITMQLRTWINDVADRAEARSWTNLAIWRSFRDNNIEIPFPQRVVSYKTEPSPADRRDRSSATASGTTLNLSRAPGPIAVVKSPELNPEILESDSDDSA